MKRFFLSLFSAMLLFISGVWAQDKKWEAIFDGQSLKGWHEVAGTAPFDVESGSIVGMTVPNTPNSFLISDNEYGDFALTFDVRIDDTSCNSGVQFRSHYDYNANNKKGKVYGYQVELDPSARRWTGGIYDEGRRDWLYPMSLNPKAQSAFKLNQFNRVVVECIGNQMRTFVNGIPCAYLVDVMDYSGFIALQVHGIDRPELAGRKIYWRNIYVKPLEKFSNNLSKGGVYVMNNIPNFLTDYEIKYGWKLLFDGSGSRGWHSYKNDSFPAKGWKIEDGVITVLPSEGHESANGGDIVTDDQFKAFDLSFDFKLTPGANSGVKYFVTLKEKNEGSAIGLEYQVLDDKVHPDAKLGRDGNRTLASLYDLIPAAKQERFIHPVGQWNTGRIIVYPNNHVEHYLNGIKVLEYERGSEAFRALVAISKFKVWPGFGEAKEGHILLQDHGNEVSFRSIKIHVLDDGSK
jgi:hypothetical protein